MRNAHTCFTIDEMILSPRTSLIWIERVKGVWTQCRTFYGDKMQASERTLRQMKWLPNLYNEPRPVTREAAREDYGVKL